MTTIIICSDLVKSIVCEIQRGQSKITGKYINDKYARSRHLNTIDTTVCRK